MKHLAIALACVLGLACQKTNTAAAADASATPSTSTAAPASATAPPPDGGTPAPPAAGAPNPALGPFGQQGAPAAPVKPVPEALPEIVARVNGEDIKKAEFENAVKSLEAQVGQKVPAERRSEIFREVLDQLIGYKLLVQESKTRNVTVTDAELDASLTQVRQQFPNEEAFKSALTAQSKTLDDFRRETRENMVIEKMLRAEVEPKVNVGQPEIQAFYDQNQERFQEPESVRASHILVKLDAGASDELKKQAQAKAEGILADVKKGTDFAELAKKNSDDGSAAQGGDLGFFGRGQMVPEFETAAFGLQPGQVSGLVQSQFGFHIIKLAEKRAARTVPFAEVSDRIKQFLGQQQQQQMTGAFVTTLRSKGKIEVLM